MMGATARLEITTMVSSRFNMHGRDVGGRKVGLLDEYQLWAYLVDPFKHRLPFQLAIEGDGGMDGQVRRMVSFFVKKKAEVSGEEQQYADLLEDVIDDWKQLNNQEGSFASCYPGPAPDRKTDAEVHTEQKRLTLEQVSTWVTKTKRHSACLRLFSTLPKSEFIEKVTTPLLSIRATGSIAVERVAKPLKNKVLTKARNSLELDKQETLLRVGLNLDYLRKMNLAARPVAP